MDSQVLDVWCGFEMYRIAAYDQALMVSRGQIPVLVGQYVLSCTDSELRGVFPGVTVYQDRPTLLWNVTVQPVQGARPEKGKRMVFLYSVGALPCYWISPIIDRMTGHWPG